MALFCFVSGGEYHRDERKSIFVFPLVLRVTLLSLHTAYAQTWTCQIVSNLLSWYVASHDGVLVEHQSPLAFEASALLHAHDLPQAGIHLAESDVARTRAQCPCTK
jgi:hypothetical protein